MTLPSLDSLIEDYRLMEDKSDKWTFLIELGSSLEEMPEALKTDETRVRGCASRVWLYPLRRDDGRLHFLADGEAAITKGVVALVLAVVQDRYPEEIVRTDILERLKPFELNTYLTPNRTQGIPGMINLVHKTAERLANGVNTTSNHRPA